MNLIERLKKLEARATPGPWKIETEGFEKYERTSYKVFPPYGDEDHYFMADATYYNTAPKKADAVFLTELRNALPKLLAIVEAAALERYPNTRLSDALATLGDTK